ncbi:MAG: 50S ribosomal protein L9 [Candidatus Hydrogenedentes bacterium]|nr:50S ribosomal protein L9 [Candidatus Hydrogenedentota bacterium]
MNVILCDDVENLGEMGQTVKVADGYARNFLIPRRLAVKADSASAKQIEHEMAIIKRREEKRRAEQAKIAKELEKLTVEIKVRAGEGDKIFGSVTAGHIAEKLAEMGQEINRKNLVLAEPIKSLGIFKVTVKFPGGIEAQIKVWVTGIEEAKKSDAEIAELAAAEAEDDMDDDD